MILMGLLVPMIAQQHTSYTQKLDSVVGSNDFDRTRWKSVYTYDSAGPGVPVRVETRYDWEYQAWTPKEKTETANHVDEALVEVVSYRWTGEDWECYLKTGYQYNDLEEQQLQHVVVMNVNDTVLEPANYTTYEYDTDQHLTLVMNYRGVDTLGQWMASSKSEYNYNEAGLLDTCVYATMQNGNWSTSERTVYSYNEDQQCVGILAQRRFGWGPFGNSWMNMYRYEFEYENGELASELYYAGGGWFGGGEMVLDSKTAYEFDTQGNLLRKTSNVYNGEDWIVRDVYENRYDLSVDASAVLGLEPYWQSTVQQGMGYVTEASMPLYSKWLSCSISTGELDTQFTLYCSGFESVGEQQQPGMKAYAWQGRLTVECPTPSEVAVFDLTGRMVASRSKTTTCEFDLTPGLYLVRGGSRVVKVLVR